MNAAYLFSLYILKQLGRSKEYPNMEYISWHDWLFSYEILTVGCSSSPFDRYSQENTLSFFSKKSVDSRILYAGIREMLRARIIRLIKVANSSCQKFLERLKMLLKIECL